jgi:hypothetical protein
MDVCRFAAYVLNGDVIKVKSYNVLSTTDIFAVKKLNSVAVVRKLTIPTERPPLVGEVSADFGVASATNSHGR